MRALWRVRKASAPDLVRLIGDPPLALTTVSTVLKVLEQKGIVRRDESKRPYAYSPLVERSEAESAAIGDLVQSFFANSKTALALRLLSQSKLTQDEMIEIRALLKNAEK